jgi:hypothetical protein
MRRDIWRPPARKPIESPLSERFGGISIMLVLSVLIISALTTAVASILLPGAQWLLLISAAAVVAAFYFSRRSTSQARTQIKPGFGANGLENHPLRYLRVSVDHQVLLNLTGRHRQTPDAIELDVATEAPDALGDALGADGHRA